MCISHQLESATVDVKHYIVEHPLYPKECHLLLVNIPGFDDTYTDDAEILHCIAIWLGHL